MHKLWTVLSINKTIWCILYSYKHRHIHIQLLLHTKYYLQLQLVCTGSTWSVLVRDLQFPSFMHSDCLLINSDLIDVSASWFFRRWLERRVQLFEHSNRKSSSCEISWQCLKRWAKTSLYSIDMSYHYMFVAVECHGGRSSYYTLSMAYYIHCTRPRALRGLGSRAVKYAILHWKHLVSGLPK